MGEDECERMTCFSDVLTAAHAARPSVPKCASQQVGVCNIRKRRIISRQWDARNWAIHKHTDISCITNKVCLQCRFTRALSLLT